MAAAHHLTKSERISTLEREREGGRRVYVFIERERESEGEWRIEGEERME